MPPQHDRVSHPGGPATATLTSVSSGEGPRPDRGARTRRRDRHGRGLRGGLAPVGVPLHRTRAERFDDLVLQAVTRLEANWETQVAGVEFAVAEIPPPDVQTGPVPLSRLEPGTPLVPGNPAVGNPRGVLIRPGWTADQAPDGSVHVPPRIVVYRRPLMARADAEDELGDLVFEVIVEEFARLLGLDPEDIDPGYSGSD